jgi:GTP pyrophosphokinase
MTDAATRTATAQVVEAAASGRDAALDDSAALIARWRSAGARVSPAEEADVTVALASATDARRSDAVETADALASLGLDGETLAAALLLVGVEPDDRGVAPRHRDPVVRLWRGAQAMGQIAALVPAADAAARKAPDHAAQIEGLRQMLLAMAQDARVVLIKLACELVRVRRVARDGTAVERATAARETFALFAPLANRLGVWQFKWALEDLAFRCSDPDTYRAIARELDGKRTDREAFIAQVVDRLRDDLREAGIAADVHGRPKHLYSIWKKMQRKDVGVDDLFDVRAVRVLVDRQADCYAALGVVHNLWTPIPREFDDYIARPKPNRYRSLHTAVTGPQGKTLEVQIRTREMHRANELGVAAHWRYKEGGAAGGGGHAGRRDAELDERIAWLREVLDWRLHTDSGLPTDARLSTELFVDTVYVLTPQGRVIALPRGSTAVDFAYHVHTDLGHRCRGARVDGAIARLDQPLASGQRVEIVTARDGGPSRDWLDPALGFIHSPRARAKVRQWFTALNHAEDVASGRAALEREAHRLGVAPPALETLASALRFAKPDDLLVALGRGDVPQRTLQHALRPDAAGDPPAATRPPVLAEADRSHAPRDGVLVVGVDRLLTQLARCCKPAPPDAIVGYVTRGRGVSVHRADCANVRRLRDERRVPAEWGRVEHDARFGVDLEVLGADDDDLMRRALDALAKERTSVLAARVQARGGGLRLELTVQTSGAEHLARVLALLRALPGVDAARRR